MEKNVSSDEIIQLIEEELPNWFTRKTAVEKLGGLFSHSTLVNYEYRKIGPPVHYMGRQACYTKKTFIEWLKNHFGSMVAEQHGFRRCVRKQTKDKEGDG